jgi:hypothetical protein
MTFDEQNREAENCSKGTIHHAHFPVFLSLIHVAPPDCFFLPFFLDFRSQKDPIPA